MPILPDGNGLPDSFFTATRDGRGFTPHLYWSYVGRATAPPDPAVDPNGWAVPAIEGPRVYLVGPRVFVVDRETPGTRKEGVDLLRCEQSVESGCPVFGYKFSGVIFTYGTHNHVWRREVYRTCEYSYFCICINWIYHKCLNQFPIIPVEYFRIFVLM